MGGRKLKTLLIGTKNLGKIRELEQSLKNSPVRILSLKDFPECPESPETGTTFLDNAAEKALFYEKWTGYPCLADDSGIEVDYLQGAPGVFSARYAGEPADDEANNQKLIAELKGVVPSQRGAAYRCVLAFAEKGKILIASEGVCRGHILELPVGTGRFGYDPYFLLDDLGKTAAEITVEEKEAVSHRGKALAKWKEWMMNHWLEK